MERPLTVGQLARATGVPAKTIRYYEQVGVLPVPRRSDAGWTSGGMTFRLQLNRPARHDMLNNDAVILHHNALDN